MDSGSDMPIVNNVTHTSQTRLCTECGKMKHFDDFSPDKRNKDGIAHVCKECRNLKAQEIFKLRDRVGETIRVWFSEKAYEEGTLVEVHPKYLVIREVISTNFEIEEIQVNVESISRIWFGYSDTRKRGKIPAWGS